MTGDRYPWIPAAGAAGARASARAVRVPVGYRGGVTTLELRDGLVTEEFIDLARTDTRSDDQERRLDALKREMAERVTARPASEVYDAV